MHVEKEIESLRKELEELHLYNDDRGITRSKNGSVDEILYREEMMWTPRRRIMWLKEGDHNTHYFHWKALWRARKNHIRCLRKFDGSWCLVPTGIAHGCLVLQGSIYKGSSSNR